MRNFADTLGTDLLFEYGTNEAGMTSDQLQFCCHASRRLELHRVFAKRKKAEEPECSDPPPSPSRASTAEDDEADDEDDDDEERPAKKSKTTAQKGKGKAAQRKGAG
jgi:hypothetical protein